MRFRLVKRMRLPTMSGVLSSSGDVSISSAPPFQLVPSALQVSGLLSLSGDVAYPAPFTISVATPASIVGALSLTGDVTASNDSDDWSTRATADGVVLADRLNTSTKLVATGTISATEWILANGLQDHITLDTSLFPPGSDASTRFAVLNADSTGSGDLGCYFGNIETFGEGSVSWHAYRVYAPPEMAYQPWKYDTESGGGGHKLSIFSYGGGSNQNNEVVTQLNYAANTLTGYAQDGDGNYNPPDVGLSTACSSSDLKWQLAIDNGSNPLSGNDPDTGSAWSSCAQDRARYGGLYSSRSLSYYRRGFGDPLSGAVRQVPNEWITIIQRVAVGNWGSTNSRWTMWAARQGQAPVLIHDWKNLKLGNAPNYNTLWLLPYTSNRQSGGRKISSRTNNVTGVTLHACGLDTPIGDGVLEWDSSTQRLRFHGVSESFGTARGFSSANDILTLNLTSGGAADSYLIATVTPGSLPSSGTVTDTVTIADGRPDTYVNYAEVIVSKQAIKASGGYLPTGVSALADAAANMSSGTWLNFSSSSGTTGLLNFSNPVAASNSGLRTSFSSRFNHDVVDRRAYYYGGDHNEDGHFLIYNEDTNAWSLDHDPAFGDIGGSSTARHSYDHNVWVPTIRKFFTKTLQTAYLQRWDGGTTWTQFPGGAGYSVPTYTNASAIGMEWFPDVGKIMLYQDESGPNGILVGIDPSSGAQTVYITAASGTLNPAGDPHNFCEYSPIHKKIFFGGGNGVNTAWTMGAAGAGSLVATTIPAGLVDAGPGSEPSLVTVNPKNGNFIVMRAASNWQEYDPIANSWSAMPGTASILSANTFYSDNAMGVIACPIHQYGVIAFIKSWARGVAAEMWLYRP